jgi:hypothetical protein
MTAIEEQKLKDFRDNENMKEFLAISSEPEDDFNYYHRQHSSGTCTWFLDVGVTPHPFYPK